MAVPRPAAAVPAAALCLCLPLATAAQERDGADPGTTTRETAPAPPPVVDLEPGAYERIVGIYRLEDGRTAVVWDLVDQMPGGRHQLAWMEPTSGRLRTLHPTSDSTFFTGPRWFVQDPRQLSLRFGGRAGGPAVRVELSEPVAGVESSGPAWPAASAELPGPAASAAGGETPGGETAGEGSEAARRTVRGARIPVRERETTFESDGVRLAGALVLPPEGVGRAPYPALVMLAGSGRLTRRTPRYVAAQFAARGVAVLIWDKRGTGASGGEFRGPDLRVATRDGVAAFRHLRSLPEVDPERVGIMASSLGGVALPRIVEEGADPAFVVCRVCPTITPAERSLAYVPLAVRSAALPLEEVLDAEAWMTLVLRYGVTGRGWEALRSVDAETADGAWREASPDIGWELFQEEAPVWAGYRHYMTTDPTATYRDLDGPALVILGEFDQRLPGGLHGGILRERMARAGREGVDVWVLPRASHGLMEVEYGEDGRRLPFRRFVPGWHDRMVEWVVDRTGGEGGEGGGAGG